MSAPLHFSELTRQLEGSLRHALELRAVELEPRFGCVIGSFRGHPARLTARVLFGPTVRFARFVTIVGDGLEIANVLCVPAPRSGLPIFGCELVGLGGGDTVVAAADLSPVDRDAPLPLLPSHALPVGGALPAWATRWFSPRALVTRTRGCHGPAIARAVTGYADAFIAIAKHAPDSGRDFTEQQLQYCRDHRQEDRALGMLEKIFGADYSREFISTVLFPEAFA